MIEFYEYVERDFESLHRGFDWINKHQLEAAIAYYEAFPEDNKSRLKTEEQTLAELHEHWAKYPQTSPHWPGRRPDAQTSGGSVSRELA